MSELGFRMNKMYLEDGENGAAGMAGCGRFGNRQTAARSSGLGEDHAYTEPCSLTTLMYGLLPEFSEQMRCRYSAAKVLASL